MMQKLKNILKPGNRSLIRQLVASDFKLRYQNSVLGYLWSLLRPLMLFGILYLIFTKVFPAVAKGVPYYPQYLLLGLVIWNFFVESTVSGMNAIVGRGDLIRKVSIPKYTIVIGSTLSAFVTLSLNLVVVVIFMLAGHVEFRWNLIFVPFLLGELVMLCLAVSFLLSTLYVKFRDVSHIWDVFLQVMFYATPIIYVLGGVSKKFAMYASLNPLTQVIQDLRSVIITPQTTTTAQVFNSQAGRIVPAVFILCLLILSGQYFKRSSKNFAEEL
jgi:ABC-2 type transport system permease protein